MCSGCGNSVTWQYCSAIRSAMRDVRAEGSEAGVFPELSGGKHGSPQREGLSCSHSISSSMALGWRVEASDRGQGLGGQTSWMAGQVSQAEPGHT